MSRGSPPEQARRRRGSVVILRALGLGDLLTAVPALRAVARAFPAHRRVLACPSALEPLLGMIPPEGGRPVVDAVADARGLGPLPARLRGADLAINLHGRGPQSHRLLLDARPERLIAFRHREVPESAGMPGWRQDEHEVARWCRLLDRSGVPADPSQLDLDLPPGVEPLRTGATVIHPGAASAARRWPVGRWAEVARSERSKGRRVLVTGDRCELGLGRTIAIGAGLRPEDVLCGRTDPVGLARVLAGAGRLVCGDTGVAHLATALRVPSVLLFGPTSPRGWGPPPERPMHLTLWAGSEGDPHADEPDPGLLEIGVEQVIEALDRLGGGSSSAAALRSAA